MRSLTRPRPYRVLGCLLLLIFVCATGVTLSQEATPTPTPDPYAGLNFRIESEIGRALPRTIIYDPVFERMAVIDAYGRLMIINALTYETQYILYEQGNYRDISFSHDGRWLALAIDTRIELYDANTGTMVADLLDLGQAKQIVGPLVFSRDDTILQFSGIYPAPRDIRITENDTVTVPWLWNLPAARNETISTFPRELEAWQFFDYKFGFFIGPNNRAVAALPGRLQILDVATLDVLFDIPTDRYERDALTLWYSLRDEQVYVRPVNFNSLIQVDLERGVLVEIPLDVDLSQNDLELIGGLELSEQARVVGEPSSRGFIELHGLMLGNDYREDYAYDDHPITITLIDLVAPPVTTGDNVRLLLFVFDERTDIGRFRLSRGGSVTQAVNSPDGELLLLRHYIDSEEQVSTYELSTGRSLRRFIPAQRGIGSYSRAGKNRVLAYDTSGEVIVSDFQRFDADTNAVLAEDLRYSRQFDSFYFTDDSAKIVTLAGSEWRVWSVATGEVLRREVVRLNGSIMATSSDGYRFLTNYASGDAEGVEVVDQNLGERKNVLFESLPARYVSQILYNPSWTKFLVVYSENQYGQYFPGNEIALYDLERGKLWFMAGDDLPPTDFRQYGWVDDETVYIYGEGNPNNQPARIFDVNYDVSGLPVCAVNAFPDGLGSWADLWERLVYRLRADQLHLLSQAICANLPGTAAGVQQLLIPTATPAFVTPTPIVVSGVPVCLTAKYPDEVERYTEVWREVTEGLSAPEVAEIETLLCEGIGKIEYYDDGTRGFERLTMFVDSETGVRSSGSFQPQEIVRRPIGPIQTLFEQLEKRLLGTAILSPNDELIAASSLPGELIVYRMPIPYQTLTDQLTATAVTNLQQANLVGVLPSLTPTFNTIGTANPTLTPTVTPTPIPRPDEPVDQPRRGETEDVCPMERLYSVTAPPKTYNPTGRLVAVYQGEDLWTITLTTGQRRPDPSVPRCGLGLNCNFSPDNQWILVTQPEEIFLVRPDGTDSRLLFSKEPPNENTPANWPPPPSINWSGGNTLEYEVQITIERNGRRERVRALQRDILGVFPDPDPWIPETNVNELPTSLISRQPGGPLALTSTSFSTGIGMGYKYYLYNTETNEYTYFARTADDPPVESFWHPLGDRLFYSYPPRNFLSGRTWYQIDAETESNQLLGSLMNGSWSNEGRYAAFRTGRRTHPIGIWDSQTGLTRNYCLPETGARLYEGGFTWSPDSKYVALLGPLPKDETAEGVGQHVMVMDIETGAVVDVTTGANSLLIWSRDPGTYGGDQ